MVQSIEQRAEGDHHLDEQIVASPWSDAEERDTTTVLSGSRDTATTFTEFRTLALDGADDAPWRIVTAE